MCFVETRRKMDRLIWFLIIHTFQVLVSALRNESLAQNASTIDGIMTCGKNWYAFGEKCYKLGGHENVISLNWEKASEYCSQLGGNLVTVSSKALLDFLITFFVLQAQRYVWIGFNDRKTESVFVWEDNSAANFTNWEQYEPTGDTYGDEDCTNMQFSSSTKIGNWNDYKCSDEEPFICQKDKTEMPVSKAPLDPKFCSQRNGTIGWKFRNSCFNFVRAKKTWSESEDYCKKYYSGHLAAVRDFTFSFYLDYMLQDVEDEIWIGISVTEASTEKWSSGWFVGYNNFGKGKEFVEGTCATRSGKNNWSLHVCSRKFYFLCENSSDSPPVLNSTMKESSCPGDYDKWVDFGGDKCYFFELEKEVNWYEANYICMERDGNLVSIHTEGELDVLQQMIWLRKSLLHIGLHRQFKEDIRNDFNWTDKTEFNWKNWDIGEPNAENEYCSVIKTSSMKFHNFGCNEKLGFICAVKKVPLNPIRSVIVTNGSEFYNITPTVFTTANDCGQNSSSIIFPILTSVLAVILLVCAASGLLLLYFYKPQRRVDQKKRTSSIGNIIQLSDFAVSRKFRSEDNGVCGSNVNYENMSK